MYRSDYGRYPTNLQALTKAGPTGEPYLTGPLLDPWGRPYQYGVTTGTPPYRLWSAGPDGVSGTPDDI